MSLLNLTSNELRRAAQLKDQVEELQNELAKLIGGGSATPAETASPKRTMSRAARAKIAAAQKARWAKQKGLQQSATPTPKKKSKMSAQGRANIIAAQKARWAKLKGTKQSVEPVKKAKRKMSAAARARISASAKARWVKAKAAGKTRL
jgi:ribosomal protein L15